ncbi:MAG: type II toxin-antitoxin system RelB/DinJ family antitoxin [Oscillospiraceae bacterium]|nr:type II toxin-antitoxin system RelB/DinJ family antitoxin [Oscillospiraceae bacterium]
MPTTNVTIRMDEDLKKEAEDLFSDLGLNLTTAFVAFVKQAVREQRMPFVLSRNIPNEETRKAIENARNGIGVSKGFSSVSDLMDDLNADD